METQVAQTKFTFFEVKVEKYFKPTQNRKIFLFPVNIKLSIMKPLSIESIVIFYLKNKIIIIQTRKSLHI